MMMPSDVRIGPNGRLIGERVTRTERRIKDLAGIFMDEAAYRESDPGRVVYEVEMHESCGPIEGGLYFGTTVIASGKVGAEYFMTKGHYHEKADRGEYYWGIAGEGLLIMMDREREASAVKVEAGSLHYVPGHTAHRIVNTGSAPLIVGACWPSDAGHDYEALSRTGFSVRVVEDGGVPMLVAVP